MKFFDASATSFRKVRATLRARLKEEPPTRIQLVVGPRQVGKTTLLLELAADRPDRSICAYSRQQPLDRLSNRPPAKRCFIDDCVGIITLLV